MCSVSGKRASISRMERAGGEDGRGEEGGNLGLQNDMLLGQGLSVGRMSAILFGCDSDLPGTSLSPWITALIWQDKELGTKTALLPVPLKMKA